jgi:hypothetical protein
VRTTRKEWGRERRELETVLYVILIHEGGEGMKKGNWRL